MVLWLVESCLSRAEDVVTGRKMRRGQSELGWVAVAVVLLGILIGRTVHVNDKASSRRSRQRRQNPNRFTTEAQRHGEKPEFFGF